MNRQLYTAPGFLSNRFIVALSIATAVIFLFGSCATSKTSYYFKTIQKDTSLTGLVNKDLESKINIGDRLNISISSLSREEDIFFNGSAVSTGTTVQPGFIVAEDGTIPVHKLGKVKAAGLTRKELAAQLQQNLGVYLKDPIVNIQYLNHKITVMGEVERPQVISMAEEQLSVIDALVISGDLKADARRDHVMVIREEGSEKKIKILNLENHSIFSSPWYYLQPNDIVYVLPDEEKRQKAEKRARFQSNFAIISASISILIILIDRLLR